MKLATLLLPLWIPLAAVTACSGTRVPDADAILASAWPEPPAPDRAREVASIPTPVDIPRQEGAPWTLDEVLAEIAAANPDLATAQTHLTEAQAMLDAAKAAYLPVLSLGLGYVSTDNPGEAFGMLLNQHRLSLGPGFDPTPGPTENWRSEVRLDWNLFEPGRNERKFAANEAEAIARLEHTAVQRRLLNAGVQAWLNLLASRSIATALERSIPVVGERLDKTRARLAEGAGLKSDVLRLTTRQAEVRQAAAGAKLAVTRAESALNRLMGRGAERPIELAEAKAEIGTELPTDLEQALARARAARHDLLAAAGRVRLETLGKKAAESGYLPALVAFGAWDIDGRDLRFDTDLDSYSVGIGLRFTLSGSTRPAVRAAAARIERAKQALRSLSLAVRAEVRDALQGIATASTNLDLTESALAAAEEGYRIVAAAQDAGGATVTDVLEAEDALRRARVHVVAGRAGVDLARARLSGAIGDVR